MVIGVTQGPMSPGWENPSRGLHDCPWVCDFQVSFPLHKQGFINPSGFLRASDPVCYT